MRILHIINSLTAGGAETLLANSLAPGGLQEHADNVLVYLNGGSPLMQKIDPKVEVICLNYTSYLKLPATLRKIRKIIREKKIDIVHSHLNPAGSYTRLAIPRRVKQVHTLHIMYTHDKETRGIFKWLEKRSLFAHANTYLIFLSELLRKDFLDHVKFKGKTFTLANFAEDIYFEERTKPANNGKFNVVAIGAFRLQKNYPYLFEIFSYLKDSNIHLSVFGAGDTTEYQKMIEEKKLPITIMGEHDNISAILPNYQLFIMPSTFEGYPLAVIEAMAGKLPCLLSNIPSLKDLAKDNAFYFELSDAEKVAKQIIDLSQNTQLLDEIGQKAFQFVSKEGRRATYIKKLLLIYDNVLSA